MRWKIEATNFTENLDKMQPHLFSSLVNALCKTATNFHDHQSLRIRIVQTLEKNGVIPKHSRPPELHVDNFVGRDNELARPQLSPEKSWWETTLVQNSPGYFERSTSMPSVDPASLSAPTTQNPQDLEDSLHAALVVANMALVEISGSNRFLGKDLAWCEHRAAKDIPQIRKTLFGHLSRINAPQGPNASLLNSMRSLDEPTRNEALLQALIVAEAALSDVGDADREQGDDVYWCEDRAAMAIPEIRKAL